jgi:hypothetical protein
VEEEPADSMKTLSFMALKGISNTITPPKVKFQYNTEDKPGLKSEESMCH